MGEVAEWSRGGVVELASIYSTTPLRNHSTTSPRSGAPPRSLHSLRCARGLSAARVDAREESGPLPRGVRRFLSTAPSPRGPLIIFLLSGCFPPFSHAEPR
jgi:hypothetical protein